LLVLIIQEKLKIQFRLLETSKKNPKWGNFFLWVSNTIFLKAGAWYIFGLVALVIALGLENVHDFLYFFFSCFRLHAVITFA